MKYFYLLIFLFSTHVLLAQNVGIGLSAPNTRLEVNGALSLSEVKSFAAGASIVINDTLSTVIITDDGASAANAVTYSIASPPSGQLLYIYNGDAQSATFYGTTISSGNTGAFIYLNGAWRGLGGGGTPSWQLLGNASTNPTNNFVGTTDAQDLAFRTSGTEKVRITTAGNIGIGTIAPTGNIGIIGNAAKTIKMERNTGGVAGQTLTVTSGGAASGGANLNGGNLVLSSGVATGTGSSDVEIRTSEGAGAGSADNVLTTRLRVMGNGNIRQEGADIVDPKTIPMNAAAISLANDNGNVILTDGGYVGIVDVSMTGTPVEGQRLTICNLDDQYARFPATTGAYIDYPGGVNSYVYLNGAWRLQASTGGTPMRRYLAPAVNINNNVILQYTLTDPTITANSWVQVSVWGDWGSGILNGLTIRNVETIAGGFRVRILNQTGYNLIGFDLQILVVD